MMNRLWTEEEVYFSGRYYSLSGAKNVPAPVQRPRPPFLVGGHGERHVLRAAARHADICNAGFEMDLDEHRATLDILGEHCRNAGRDISEIEVSHNTRVMIGRTAAEFDRLVSRGGGGCKPERGRIPGIPVPRYRRRPRAVCRANPALCRRRDHLLLPPVSGPHPHRKPGAIRQGSDASVRSEHALSSSVRPAILVEHRTPLAGVEFRT